jgi:hypothetical protein
MTAEIGILNRNGVALAADSAVTVGYNGRQKVFNTANKLFALSKRHPVGIMIYGGADFMSVPWETIVKIFREELGDSKYNTLEEYADRFISFISSDSRFVSEETEKMAVIINFKEYLSSLLMQVNKEIHDTYKTVEPSPEQVAQILHINIKNKLQEMNETPFLKDNDRENILSFLGKHSSILVEIIKHDIHIPISEELSTDLQLIGGMLFCKDIFINYTGVVISGFGEEEIFPVLKGYQVDGIYDGKMKFKICEDVAVNAVRGQKPTAAVIPFAQQEMVQSFIRGIDPTLNQSLQKSLGSIFDNFGDIVEAALKNNSTTTITEDDKNILAEAGIEISRHFKEKLEEIQMDLYVRPLLDIVSLLPKEELAAMAEALVNLTSFKRKVSIDAETVGGPIDVAVITKGDGFIWIRRKHYFQPELNYNFFQNNHGQI